MRTCKACQRTLDDTKFYRHHRDGYRQPCKACHYGALKARRAADPDFVRRETRSKALRLAVRRATDQAFRIADNRRGYLRRMRRVNRDPQYRAKWAARKALRYAVARGNVAKPATCSSCGASPGIGAIHGHHTDYSQPLAVVWLCAQCHATEHA